MAAKGTHSAGAADNAEVKNSSEANAEAAAPGALCAARTADSIVMLLIRVHVPPPRPVQAPPNPLALRRPRGTFPGDGARESGEPGTGPHRARERSPLAMIDVTDGATGTISWRCPRTGGPRPGWRAWHRGRQVRRSG